MSLTRDDIVARSLDLLDSYGFADLSMRRVATSLGIAPSALYWHVASKQELLQAMAGAILADVPAPTLPTAAGTAAGTVTGAGAESADAWEDAVRAWAHDLRAALMGRRDGAELVASALAMRPEGLDPANGLASLLVAAGLRPAEASGAAATFLHFVLGHAVDEQGHDQMRQFGVAARDDETADSRFGYGVDLLVAGIGLALVAAAR